MGKTKRRVLVTGAGGFIGSHLCERLIEDGYTVRALVKYNSRNSWGWLEELEYKTKLSIVSGDIRDFDSVKSAMKGVDLVFNLAALIAIPYSYYSPDSYVDTNIRGTLNILQVAKELKIGRLIQVSTSEVYGTAQIIPITENHPLNPQSPYAASKISADFLALSFYSSFSLPVVVVRPFNTFGSRQSARAIIPTIITQILNGNKTIKLGSLSPTRDFTYVKDIVDGFIKAAKTDKAIGEIINLGTNSEISMGDLVKLISKIIGVKVKVEVEPKRVRPQISEVRRLRADNEKAKSLLGWSPKVSLEQGLKRTISWFKENKNSYKPEIYNV